MQQSEHWYRVKGVSEIETYIRVIGERDHGYQIMIASFYEDFCRESTEYISRHLFEACVRTGYLIPGSPPCDDESDASDESDEVRKRAVAIG